MIVIDCIKMFYTCAIKAYDAGRAPGERQRSARRAQLLRAGAAHSAAPVDPFISDESHTSSDVGLLYYLLVSTSNPYFT